MLPTVRAVAIIAFDHEYARCESTARSTSLSARMLCNCTNKSTSLNEATHVGYGTMLAKDAP